MNEMILVVDDESRIVKQARDYLERGGFRVVTAADGPTGLALARHERPDLVVLDLNLPGMDGLDVCRALRRTSDVPIIMLTARVEETDRLIGLELGADDYITKPFSPRELVARIRAVLRRVQGGVRQTGVLRAADLEIDLNGHRVSRAGSPITLSRTEFNLLEVLVRNAGRVVSKQELSEQGLGRPLARYDRGIDVHLSSIRHKLGPDSEGRSPIQTVRGVGYQYVRE